MKEVDTDGSGTVEYQEFLILMKGVIKTKYSEDEIRRAFRIYDEDDTGKISFSDLKRIANEIKPDLTDAEIQGMIYEADRDKDGEVSIDEFIKIIKRAKLM